MKTAIIIVICFPLITAAQQKPLSIGDSLPASILASLSRIEDHESPTSNSKQQTTNYKSQTIHSKLFILDFFATFCTACIKELPKLDSLQQQFADQLQIIIVAAEPLQKLQALRKKNTVFASCQLPIVPADTILKKHFPHLYLPHEVWLDNNGKVLAITDQYAVTKENIQAFLNGVDPKLTVKSDAFEFDRKKPLLLDNNGGTNDNLLFQSKFTNYLPGIASSTVIDRSNGQVRWAFINYPIIHLYKEAFGFDPNRVIFETADSSRFTVSSYQTEEWKTGNLFSWELIAPKDFPKQSMQKILAADLDRYLGLHGRIEKRTTSCFAITRLNQNDTALKSKAAKPSVKYNDRNEILFINQPFSKIIDGLNTRRSSRAGSAIFIDETNIAFNIDITFPKAAKEDLSLLKKFLYSHGLRLTGAIRDIEMFILSTPQQF